MSRLFCQPINRNTTKNIFFCPDFLRLLLRPSRKAARCFLHGIFAKLQRVRPVPGGRGNRRGEDDSNEDRRALQDGKTFFFNKSPNISRTYGDDRLVRSVCVSLPIRCALFRFVSHSFALRCASLRFRFTRPKNGLPLRFSFLSHRQCKGGEPVA